VFVFPHVLVFVFVPQVFPQPLELPHPLVAHFCGASHVAFIVVEPKQSTFITPLQVLDLCFIPIPQVTEHSDHSAHSENPGHGAKLHSILLDDTPEQAPGQPGHVRTYVAFPLPQPGRVVSHADAIVHSDQLQIPKLH